MDLYPEDKLSSSLELRRFNAGWKIKVHICHLWFCSSFLFWHLMITHETPQWIQSSYTYFDTVSLPLVQLEPCCPVLSLPDNRVLRGWPSRWLWHTTCACATGPGRTEATGEGVMSAIAVQRLKPQKHVLCINLPSPVRSPTSLISTTDCLSQNNHIVMLNRGFNVFFKVVPKVHSKQISPYGPWGTQWAGTQAGQSASS